MKLLKHKLIYKNKFGYKLWHDILQIEGRRVFYDYLERTKGRRNDAQWTLEYVLKESLKLLHPFMPFVTETIWQEGKERFDSTTLIEATWPKI